MVSVRKLVLVPVEDFERLTQGKENELPWINTPREVQVPVQDPPTTVPAPPLPSEVEEQAAPSSPPPPSSPPQEGKGEGEGEEKEEVYVPRESTGKKVPLTRHKSEAGVWRPPGRPAERAKRKWIHV